MALDGATGSEIRPVKRFIIHPKAKSQRGFFQNDLVITR